MKASWNSSTTSSIRPAGSVRMRATFANADGRWCRACSPASSLTAAMARTRKPALLINDAPSARTRTAKFVFVVDADNKAEYRAVKLGQNSDGLRVVRGLKAGEKSSSTACSARAPRRAVTPQMVAMDFDPTAPVAPAKPEVKDAKIAAKAASTSKE
jgi:multidrug efflux system membrane fusion protein